MQKAENRALELFNQALKQAIHLDKELLKEEAKSIVLKTFLFLLCFLIFYSGRGN